MGMAVHPSFTRFSVPERSARAYYALGQILANKPKYYRKLTIQAFSCAIERDACYVPAYLARGQLYLRICQFKAIAPTRIGLRRTLLKVISDFTHVLILDEDNHRDLYVQRAEAYYQLMSYDLYAYGSFIEDYEQAICYGFDMSHYTDDMVWISARAAVFTRDYDKALFYLDKAYAPHYSKTYFYRRAQLFRMMDKEDEAIADTLRASAHDRLVSAYEKAGLFEEARAILQENCEKEPHSLWPRIYLAQFYSRHAYPEQALTLYSSLLQSLKEEHRLHSYLSYLHRECLAECQ
jgi:hypothetical protein